MSVKTKNKHEVKFPVITITQFFLYPKIKLENHVTFLVPFIKYSILDENMTHPFHDNFRFTKTYSVSKDTEDNFYNF